MIRFRKTLLVKKINVRVFRQVTARFRQSATGAALVEFAIVGPVFLMIFMGLSDVTRGVVLQQKLNMLAESIGRTVAAMPAYTGRVRQSVDLAVMASLTPSEREDFVLNIYRLQNINAQTYEIFVDRRFNSKSLPIKRSKISALGLGNKESVIYVATEYTFKPFFAQYFKSDVIISSAIVYQPITSQIVEYSNELDWSSDYVY